MINIAQQIKQQGFLFKIDRKTIEQVIKSVKVLTDEIEFIMDVEGINIRTMNSDHVTLIDVGLSNMSFEKYDVNSEIRFKVKADTLLNVIRSFNKKDNITFEPTIDHKLKLSTRDTEYKIYLLESSKVNTPLPKIPYNVTALTNFEAWQKEFKRMAKLGQYMTIESRQGDNDRLFATVKADDIESISQLTTLNDNRIEVREHSSTTYSLEYLNSFTRTLDPKSVMEFSFSNSKPCKLEVKLDNVSRMSYLIAPRVEQ